MKKRIFSVILAALTLTACGDKTNGEKTSNEEQHSGVRYICGSGVYDTGMTYSAGQGEHRVTKFLDFNSLETAPLCAVPNCTHSMSSSDCLARTSGDSPFLYGDSLFYFKMNGTHGSGDMLETPDGLEFVMESKLMRASLDSSETEEVCVFTDALAREGMYLILENTVYFIAYDPDPNIDGMGGASWGSGGGYDFLCSINLDTGEYTNYGYFCYVEDEYPAADNSSGANLEGFYNGKIMLQYSFMKEIVRNEEGNVAPDETDFTVYMYEFDPVTKEFSESTLPESAFMNDRYYVSNESDALTVFSEDKTYTVKNMSYCTDIVNSRLVNYTYENCFWSEIGGDKVYALDGKYKKYEIVAFHDGKYILFNDREAVKLTEEELVENSKIYEEEQS